MKMTPSSSTQIADAIERVARPEPHRASDDLRLPDRYAAIAKTGSMQVQPVDAKPLAYFCGFTRRSEQDVGASVGQSSFEIAVHDRECGPRAFQRAQVMGRPVPQAHAEAQLLQTRGTPVDWFVAPQQFPAQAASWKVMSDLYPDFTVLNADGEGFQVDEARARLASPLR